MRIDATRARLEAQGFCNLDDAALRELGPWMRWAPALCAVTMIVGTALRSPVVLWALAATAAAGVFLPFHPFDLFYNYGVRFMTATQRLPSNTPQRRFACAIAAVWLSATGVAFHAGANTVGIVLGVAIIAIASLVSLTHVCIPSILYNAILRLKTAERAT